MFGGTQTSPGHFHSLAGEGADGLSEDRLRKSLSRSRDRGLVVGQKASLPFAEDVLWSPVGFKGYH